MRTRLSTSLFVAAATCFIGTASLSAQGYSRLVAFGDSLSDEGNTISTLRAAALFDPSIDIGAMVGYDDAYYNSASNAYGIPAAGRFSNGPTWVEYLNGQLFNQANGGAPLALGSYGLFSSGTNFSWAGTTSGAGHSHDVLPNLFNQITSYTSSVYAPDASTTLFSVWSGGNDAINWVKAYDPDAPGISMEAATTAAAENIAAAITTLYTGGGRSFIVPNLPALGFKPDFLGHDEEILANAFAVMFNTKLAIELAALNLDDAIIFDLDIYAIFNEVRDNYTDYNFVNREDMAFTYSADGSTTVGNPQQYIFWDNTHPTSQMHEILGNYAFQSIPEPSTYLLLSAGAALGLWARRRKAA